MQDGGLEECQLGLDLFKGGVNHDSLLFVEHIARSSVLSGMIAHVTGAARGQQHAHHDQILLFRRHPRSHAPRHLAVRVYLARLLVVSLGPGRAGGVQRFRRWCGGLR